ncbi:MAG: hypothetical protein FWG10_00705 [Eubacteriaceae bacterium]|nr:hypothetical protein [Eubacteriaceae bacterium]
MMNFTTNDFDAGRYSCNADLINFYNEFSLDGVELMQGVNELEGIALPGDVVGVHLRYFTSWMDLWLGDIKRLHSEYGDNETVEEIYGGSTKGALTAAFKDNLDFASKYNPEYLVYHVSECQLSESMLRCYHYNSKQVAAETAKLVDSFAQSIPKDVWFLYENLWYPGLDMLDVDLAYRLIGATVYRKTGIMLDIGHLMNTNISLRGVDEGVDYIHSVLDTYPDLSIIKGIHLHLSLSGEYAQNLMASWIPGPGSYKERRSALMRHIYNIDNHVPFPSRRINEIIERINPLYLTLEFMSIDRLAHSRLLKEQISYLNTAVFSS